MAKSLVTLKTKKELNERKGDWNNAAVVNMTGDDFSGGGFKDVQKEASAENKVNAETMFAEGSVGKVRYAGLAYMLQQEGIFDLQQNAQKFFAQENVRAFLEKKYPGHNIQKAILGLFTNRNEKATIADLTTHRSGVGDTTTDALEMVKARGSGYNFTIPDLVLPQKESVVPRDENGKPMAKKGLRGDLAPAVYGEHEYSNLGYQILGVAMEAAYFIHGGKEKTYQQLTEDFLLHPIEGRAKDSGLQFDRTKFPKDLNGDGNVVQSQLMENGAIVNTNKMSAANAAGGIFASASDSVKFFTEFFKGFPGLTEKEVNPFFTPETIEKMTVEAYKHKSHANQPAIDAEQQSLKEWQARNPSGEALAGDKKPTISNPQLQFPGVVADTNEQGEITGYTKGGGTLGYKAKLEFDTKTGNASISMIHQENLSAEKDKDHRGWVDKMGLEGNTAKQRQSFIDSAKPYVSSQKWVDTASSAAKTAVNSKDSDAVR